MGISGEGPVISLLQGGMSQPQYLRLRCLVYRFGSSVAMTTGQGLLWVTTDAPFHDDHGHTKPAGDSPTTSTRLQNLHVPGHMTYPPGGFGSSCLNPST